MAKIPPSELTRDLNEQTWVVKENPSQQASSELIDNDEGKVLGFKPQKRQQRTRRIGFSKGPRPTDWLQFAPPKTGCVLWVWQGMNAWKFGSVAESAPNIFSITKRSLMSRRLRRARKSAIWCKEAVGVSTYSYLTRKRWIGRVEML